MDKTVSFLHKGVGIMDVEENFQNRRSINFIIYQFLYSFFDLVLGISSSNKEYVWSVYEILFQKKSI